jgi:hypothetical protein
VSAPTPPNKFTWGDDVRVRTSAPSEFRPGEYAAVCAITEPGSGRNTYFYIIEFGDGSSVHTAEEHFERYEF